MAEPVAASATVRFAATLAAQAEQRWSFRLYVAGATPASQRAVKNLNTLCETHMAGRYSLEVVDLYQNPERAQQDEIVVAPTLARLNPEPLLRIVGDLGDERQVLAHLDVRLHD